LKAKKPWFCIWLHYTIKFILQDSDGYTCWLIYTTSICAELQASSFDRQCLSLSWIIEENWFQIRGITTSYGLPVVYLWVQLLNSLWFYRKGTKRLMIFSKKILQCYIQSINLKKIHCHSKTYPIYCIPPWLHSSKIKANDILPNKYYKIADTTARKVSLSQRYNALQRQ
jgi:hypothetical protein